MGRIAATQMACSARPIAGQNVTGRGVNRYQPGLAELGAAYREHTVVKIDIIEPQSQRLAHAHTCHAQ